jgi:acyl-CoA thioester hydrolase
MSARRRFRVAIPIRFADIDALGHVNNAVFLSYLEVARTSFWSEHVGPVRVREIDFVVARVEIDYRRPVVFGDALTCDMWFARFGRSSFTVAYAFEVGGKPVAEARSVLVFIDPTSGSPKPMPDGFRERVGEFVAED